MLEQSKSLKLMAAMVAFMVAGCTTASTGFHETITDPDGTVDETEYKAVSSAAPFGKLDTTGHTWLYKFGDNKIETGQKAQGMDNSGQSILIPILTELIKQLAVQSATPAAPPGPQQPVAVP